MSYIDARANGGSYAYVTSPISFSHSDDNGHQVSFGRMLGISPEGQKALVAHYGHAKELASRISQHVTDHAFHVTAALESGRPLTRHEKEFNDTGKSTKANVAHIIGNSTMHNLLNRMTAQYLDAGERITASAKEMKEAQKLHTTLGFRVGKRPDISQEMVDEAGQKVEDKRRTMFSSIASQAAAVARVRGLGRAMLAEEAPHYGYGQSVTLPSDELRANIIKRNALARDVTTAFSTEALRAERYSAFKRILKNTVDSVGNLRLGNINANSNVGSGFDMPLKEDMTPSDRGQRLYDALYNYGPEDMEQPATVMQGKEAHKVGHFSTNGDGERLSSSVDV